MAAIAIAALWAFLAVLQPIVDLFESLPGLEKLLVGAAAAVAAIKTLWAMAIGPAYGRVKECVAAVKGWGQDVHAATTADLPARMERVESEQAASKTELAEMKAQLTAYANVERAAVKGALEAAARPRSARATDPGVRTGWRE